MTLAHIMHNDAAVKFLRILLILAGFLLPGILAAQTRPATTAALPRGMGLAESEAPAPSDVLTPNIRRNTPNLKIGVRAGFNLSSYSNDRYINNVPLDVGQVSGESNIYSAATGFGFQAGVDIEYPLNTGLSILLSGEYDHIRFGSKGPVTEPCVNAAGAEHIGTSLHDFTATIDYIKIAPTAKFSFSTFYLTFGITADIPASTSLERDRSFSEPNCFFPNSGNLSAIHEEGTIPDPNRIHYSLRMGMGLIYQWSRDVQFAPELTLDFGFNTINKSPNSDLGVYGISGTVRYDL
jgi:hypothetical protein